MAKASSVPTNGSDWGKNSFANTRPVTVLYKKKSYHSIAVPTVDAMTARRSWALCSSGLKALEPFLDLGVTVVSLAKRIEEVFVPGSSTPIVMRHDTPGLQLLQRARDEAHRFAIEFHRGRRDKAMTRSVLDDLPGVGPARKRLFLSHFGTPERFLEATREELEAVPGVPGKVARDVYEYVNKIR